MKIFSLLLMISFQTYAQECVKIDDEYLKNFKDIQEHLDWHGADAAQVAKAPCKTLAAPSISELDTFIKSKSKGSANAKVNGVSFKDESPKLIEVFKNLTTAKDGFGYKAEPKEQKDFQSTHKINPACDKVLCAVEKIWGKLGKKILYLQLKHNYNGSEYAFSNSDRFKEEELDDVLMGLDDLPAHLIPMGQPNQRLTHFKRGYTLAAYGPDVVANAVVMLFDTWTNEPRGERQYTIFHEVAHNTASKLQGMDESPEWLKLSGWIKKGDKWSASKDACQSTKYGETNPWEDFAETMSTYRYNGSKLKKQCPKKFAFFKNKVFKGIEYTSLASCAPIKAAKIEQAKELILKNIKSELKEQSFSSEEVAKVCKKVFSYPLQENEVSECSLMLMTQSDQVNTSEKIASALKTAGIEDTPFNRELVLSDMNTLIKEDKALTAKMISSAKGVTEGARVIVDKAFENAMPKVLTDSDVNWWMYNKNCKAKILSGISQKALTECHVDDVIKKDKESQYWGNGALPKYVAPEIFKPEAKLNLEQKRDELLKNNLLEQEAITKAIGGINKDFKISMDYHLMQTSNRLYDAKGWKKESPEAFCTKYYSASSDHISQYGVKKGEQVQSIQDWCVKNQSTKKRRKEISSKEWSEFVNTTFL